MSWRQPAATSNKHTVRIERTTNTEDAEDTEVNPWNALCVLGVLCVEKSLLSNGTHLSRIQRLQEGTCLLKVELGILRLDAQEEAVAAREREARDVEHGMVRLRQPVE